jgi:hypothetical protein
MNPRERMRQSNRRAVNYLLSKGYDDIWLKPHGRRQDLVYTLGEWYRALDLWNLFDGICFDPDGNIILIQIKTNAWAQAKPITDFLSNKNNIKALVINVKVTGRKWEVLVREYESYNRKRRKDCSLRRKRVVRRKRILPNANSV